MTPQEIAKVRPRLLDFTAEMLGGLPRKDQRAAGELYVRGLLTDGQRKSMVPMAARLGTDHQRLQQFITSSTWDYAAVRRNVARWFAAGQPVEALVVDDTGFPKGGEASPGVARQYSGTLGKTANCQIGVSVHLVNEGASCAADWRLFCPESWDDAALADPVAGAGAARRRERAGIPDEVRHREKWRLALDMIGEMTGPGGWGVLDLATAAGGSRPVVAADIGYGDNALFRQELTAAGWQYAVAIKGGTTAHDGGAVPQARPYGGLGPPPQPPHPGPPAAVRPLALAHAGHVRPGTSRHRAQAPPGKPPPPPPAACAPASSPSLPGPSPPAPSSGLTQKRLRRDAPLPGPARPADRPRRHPRRLPPVPPARPPQPPRRRPHTDLTKY